MGRSFLLEESHTNQVKKLFLGQVLRLSVMCFSLAAFQTGVFAAGGDFANTDFTAAGPYSYDHATGGGAYDDGSNSKSTGVVESLEGTDFACMDIISFFTAIKISANPIHANQTAEFNFKFLADSTGQSGAAITDVIYVGVNRGSVDYGAGPGGTDAGLVDDGGSIAALVSETVVGTLFTPGSEVRATVRVDDLEANEQVIIRIDVRLLCQPGTSPTGNLQAQLDSGRVISPVNDVINTGQQTIPFLKVGDLAGAGEPLLIVSKTVTTVDGACPGSETITIEAGQSVKYCYTVSNPGTFPLYNVTLIDDNGTPNNTADDFTVSLSGLTDGGLPAGASATGTVSVISISAGTVTGIATATGNNNLSGSKQVIYMDIDTTTVIVTGQPNRPPVANDDIVTVAEDSATLINTTQNDTDAENDLIPSSVAVVNGPMKGTLTSNGDGTFTYTPNTNYNGIDSFTYQVCDSQGLCDSAEVTITVSPMNDAPVAIDDSATTSEDIAVTFPVLGNDSDMDGDSLTVSNYTQPNNGALILNQDGTFTYTPNANYNGSDSFTYTVSDGNGGTATATVNLTVTPINDDPVAINDSLTVSEDTALTIRPSDLLGNDSDGDGDTLVVSINYQPSHGVLTLNLDGTFIYTPNANYNGPDFFIYTVSDGNGGTAKATVYLTVIAVNDPPVAVNDSYSAAEDMELTIAIPGVLGNDSDGDEDSLTVSGYSQPSHGSVTLNPDGTFIYTPNTNFYGTDSFTYTVSDGNGGTAAASVTLALNPVNDVPLAVNDSFNAGEDTPITIAASGVLSNDSDTDGDLLLVDAYTQPSYGTVALNPDGSFTYHPDHKFDYLAEGEQASDSFSYLVSDGQSNSNTATVTVIITGINDAPVAFDDFVEANEDAPVIISVLENDFDIDGNSLAISDYTLPSNGNVALNSDGTFTYTPNANFNGFDSFTYTICDLNDDCDGATVTVTISSINDAPVAVNDAYNTDEDTPLTVNDPGVLGNDSDVDGDALTAGLVAVPVNGSVVLNSNGSFTYTPNANYHGPDSFTYTVLDGNGGTATATVALTVNPVNDAPVAADDYASTQEDTAVTIEVLNSDSDIDGDNLTVESYSQPSNGSVTLNADGAFTYTPSANFYGTDFFTYTVADGNGGTAIAAVTLTVNPVNDAPVAVDNAYAIDEDQVLTITTSGVLGNDSDVDMDSLTVNSNSQSSYGILTLNSDGSFTYTPNANYNGPDSFTYSVTDGNGGYAAATVSLTVNSINDTPVAQDDSATTPEDTAVNISVTANDTDVDNNLIPSSVTVLNGPANGALINNGDGSFTYTPNANFHGSDSFTYNVSDGVGDTATATVTLTVNSVNDAPLAQDDSATTPEDMAVTIPVLGNDSDVDGDTLTVSGYTQPAHGALLLNPDGTFTYTPNSNYNGPDSFTYTVSDGNGGIATVTVTLTVSSVNDAPLAVDDGSYPDVKRYTTNQDTLLSVVSNNGVLGNDSDLDGDVLTVSSFSTSSFNSSYCNGTFSINSDGSFSYTPAPGFAGYDAFDYTLSDGHGGTDSATVFIEVASRNNRSISVDFDQYSLSGNKLSGSVTITNQSGGYDVQVIDFQITVQYKLAGDKKWTDIPVDMNSCMTNPALYFLVKQQQTFKFENCLLNISIPAGAETRVTAKVQIYGRIQGSKTDGWYLDRISNVQ